MIRTGLAIRPAASGKREGGRVRQCPLGSHPFGRNSLTLPRPGEERKDACPAANAHTRVQGVTVALIPPVKADFPAPIPGQMEAPAVVRRPFPVTRVVQMEIFL